jgi:hypothetical protein
MKFEEEFARGVEERTLKCEDFGDEFGPGLSIVLLLNFVRSVKMYECVKSLHGGNSRSRRFGGQEFAVVGGKLLLGEGKRPVDRGLPSLQ